MRKIISLKPNLNKLKSNQVENKISDPWTSIGTILGQTSIDDYSFHLKNLKQKKVTLLQPKQNSLPVTASY